MFTPNHSIRLLGAAGGVAATLLLLLAVDGCARRVSQVAMSRAQIVRLPPVTVIGERPVAGDATAAVPQGTTVQAL
jgi:hypothetical protein